MGFARWPVALTLLRRWWGQTPAPELVQVGDLQRASTIILIYNSMFRAPLRVVDRILPPGFALTTDRRWLSKASAVVFHVPSLKRLPSVKPAGQLWVAWSMECPQNVPSQLDPKFMAKFDLTMTHRLDADVVTHYCDNQVAAGLAQPPRPKTEFVAAFISSRHNRSGRIDYLRELLRHLPVHSYGRVLRNRELPQDAGQTTKLEVISRYHFTLAFENAIEVDYVTEKFFGPLQVGSVPVYLGAANVDRFSPGENSFLNVKNYPRPHDLAAKLQALAADPKAYAAMLEWKKRPLLPGLAQLIEMNRTDSWIRLCYAIRARLDSA
jgi:hypothetical protein